MTIALHTLPFAHFAGLRCCSSASGISHHADERRATGGARRGLAGGGMPLMNAQAARSTAARSASGPYHAAVAGRPPYRAGGRVSSRAVRIRFSGNNAIVMPLILSKYVRRCYIIRVKLCSSENLTAQFSDNIATWPSKGGIRIAA